MKINGWPSLNKPRWEWEKMRKIFIYDISNATQNNVENVTTIIKDIIVEYKLPLNVLNGSNINEDVNYIGKLIDKGRDGKYINFDEVEKKLYNLRKNGVLPHGIIILVDCNEYEFYKDPDSKEPFIYGGASIDGLIILRKFNLKNAVKHEFGHMIGLISHHKNCVMNWNCEQSEFFCDTCKMKIQEMWKEEINEKILPTSNTQSSIYSSSKPQKVHGKLIENIKFKKRINMMNLPERIDLPFFDYGIFKPCQLGFSRLREFVQNIEENCIISGTLRVRDGLPIIDMEKKYSDVNGSLMFFKEDCKKSAYEAIIDIEPDKHYFWGIGEVYNGKQLFKANILFGKNPESGSSPHESSKWDGANDPLFTSALEVVNDVLQQNKEFNWDLKPLFRLQMAYLLLWSAIERYVSLRYHLGDKVSQKINKLSTEKAFIQGLKKYVPNDRIINRADKPSEKVRLSSSKPRESIQYYYQVRSNVIHRGKGVNRDFDILKDSLDELYKIFKDVLEQAFKEAR